MQKFALALFTSVTFAAQLESNFKPKVDTELPPIKAPTKESLEELPPAS
jgi:hypothetical protein